MRAAPTGYAAKSESLSPLCQLGMRLDLPLAGLCCQLLSLHWSCSAKVELFHIPGLGLICETYCLEEADDGFLNVTTDPIPFYGKPSLGTVAVSCAIIKPIFYTVPKPPIRYIFSLSQAFFF